MGAPNEASAILAMLRPTISSVPPAGYGTTSLIGRDGNSLALAATAATAPATASTTTCIRRRARRLCLSRLEGAGCIFVAPTPPGANGPRHCQHHHLYPPSRRQEFFL